MASSEVDKTNQDITDSSKGDEDEDIVNPWAVASSSSKGVDYEKLIGEYIILNIVNIIHPFLELYCRWHLQKKIPRQYLSIKCFLFYFCFCCVGAHIIAKTA